MIHIGRISYGIYLLHMFIISFVKKLPGGTSPVLCFLLSAGAVIIVASLVYRHFEYPIIAYYKKRLSPLGRAPVVPAPAKEPSGLTTLLQSQSGR
jgi:peptidoglycan/LPS O-acetylase OafA/YrhL